MTTSQAIARIVEFQLFLTQPRTLERGSVDYKFNISKFNVVDMVYLWLPRVPC